MDNDAYHHHHRTLAFSEQSNLVNNGSNNGPVLVNGNSVGFDSSHTNSVDDGNGNVLCAICGDKATGKHYGANSCDGCKGFFRRSVRKNHSYACRFNRQCIIDKDKRNQCRYCRLRKCFRAGMKKAAVQNERDKINNRRASYDDTLPSNLLTMNSVMMAEHRIRGIYAQIQSGQFSQDPNGFLGQRFAALDDVCDSMKSQLLLLVEWAKSLLCFGELALADKISLLQAHAGEMLILGVVWRSLLLNRDDSLILGNNLIISRDSNPQDIANIAGHILDELFLPLRDIQLDENEFACLRAMVFFDPNAKNLSDNCRRFVRQCRHQIQLDLMNHMNDKQYSQPGRFGDLILLLPDLRKVTQMMVEKVHLAKLMGFAKIDNLLSDTLLSTAMDLNCCLPGSETLQVSQPQQLHPQQTGLMMNHSGLGGGNSGQDSYRSMGSEMGPPSTPFVMHHAAGGHMPGYHSFPNPAPVNLHDPIHGVFTSMSDSGHTLTNLGTGQTHHQSDGLHYTNLEPPSNIQIPDEKPHFPFYLVPDMQNHSRSLPSSPHHQLRFSHKLSPLTSPRSDPQRPVTLDRE